MIFNYVREPIRSERSVRPCRSICIGMEGNLGTDRATRARIAALTAAEAAIERNPRDPFEELANTCADAAKATHADPEEVYELADVIVTRVFRGELDKAGSLEFVCVSCGAPLPEDSHTCPRCAPELPPIDES